MSAGTFEFSGTERFAIVRRLGEGGMGVVYEAVDRQRDETVALKLLRWADAGAIYHFKEEFRTLAGVVHPNLVSLYELIVAEEEWFFTMELVTGVDFIRFVRPSYSDEEAPSGSAAEIRSEQLETGRRQAASFGRGPRLPSAGEFDEERLRSTLAQLARGVHALHLAGKMHRDVKPSNVMVTPQGRVVILDFGIAVETVTERPIDTRDDGIWGTAAYMAPEQGAGAPGPASDWYAVGVMLYQALTGRLPFTGTFFNIMIQKVQTDPVHPDELVQGLPSDLVDLCLALLARNLSARPHGPDILRRLGVPAPDDGAALLVSPHADTLLGRGPQFAELENAFAGVGRGHAVAVYVQGVSGIGKTTLVQRFIDTVVRREGAVALTGRCHLRESIPYKALDGVIDSLSRFLRTLTRDEADSLVPPDVAELTRVFPVLLRVDAVAQALRSERETRDPVELRRRAFGALRELLARLGGTRPLVMYIDDLQWADDESAHLIAQLLSPPEPPPVLLLTTFRSEDIDSQGFLRDLLARVDGEAHRQIRLDPLNDHDTRQLILSLLGPEQSAMPADVDLIARESAGNPFLVEEFARYALTSTEGAAERASLSKMLDARVRQLPAGAAQLLQTVAIAGHPIDAEVAFRAASLTGDERPLVSALLAAKFLRSSGATEGIELFHDRIRETLAARPDAATTRATHLRLAETLEAQNYDDPEVLFEHYLEGGKPKEAAKHAARAASKAIGTLAFDRAALYYQRALELAPEDQAAKPALLAGLGDALSNAGRLREAAHAYTSAAAVADPTEVLELHRLAAEQLLISGRIEEGLLEIRRVLQAAGLRMAKSPGGALAMLLLRRVRLRLRLRGDGLRFTERDPSQVAPERLARIDACRTVAEGLVHLDFIHAADFQTRHSLLSLQAGEPDRVAHALAIEAGFAILGGGSRAERRSQMLLQQAQALATRINSPHALALCSLIAGTTSFFSGYFARARVHLEEAQQRLLDHGVHVAWERMTAQIYQTLSLYYLGEIKELARCAETFLADAEQRGNRFADTIFRTGGVNVVWLAKDDVTGACHALTDALSEWPEEPFRTPHYLGMVAEGRISLYRGDGRAAWNGLMDKWPAFKATRLLRIESIRVVMFQLRATCAIAASGQNHGDEKRLLSAAARDARRVERADRPWSRGLAALLRAAIARAHGNTDSACRTLREAIDRLDHAGLVLHATAGRRCLAGLVGGTEGTELMAAANQWMEAQSIQNPERMTLMVAPGFQD